MGNRMSQTRNGVTTQYLVDTIGGLSQVIGENVHSTNPIWYFQGVDTVAQRMDVEWQYFGYDGLGSVRQMMNTAGEVIYSADYDPYGATTQKTGLAKTALGYTGEYTDPSGLLYLRARYYDPNASDSFLSHDPVKGVVGSESVRWNPYLYTGGNPINFVDPNGELFLELMLVGAFIFGGVNLAKQGNHNMDQGMSFWDAIHYENLDIGSIAQESIKGGLAGALLGGALWSAGLVNLGGTAVTSVLTTWQANAVLGSTTNILGGILTNRYAESRPLELLGKLTTDGVIGGLIGIGFGLFTPNYVPSSWFIKGKSSLNSDILKEMAKNTFKVGGIRIRGLSHIWYTGFRRAFVAGSLNAIQGIASRVTYNFLGFSNQAITLEDIKSDFRLGFFTSIGIDVVVGISTLYYGLPRLQMQREATASRPNPEGLSVSTSKYPGVNFGFAMDRYSANFDTSAVQFFLNTNTSQPVLGALIDASGGSWDLINGPYRPIAVRGSR